MSWLPLSFWVAMFTNLGVLQALFDDTQHWYLFTHRLFTHHTYQFHIQKKGEGVTVFSYSSVAATSNMS